MEQTTVMPRPQIPSIGRIVIYNHSGSADGKFPPMQSPAIVQKVTPITTPKGSTFYNCDMFVMSNGNGTHFAKNIPFIDDTEYGMTSWEWPPRI